MHYRKLSDWGKNLAYWYSIRKRKYLQYIRFLFWYTFFYKNHLCIFLVNSSLSVQNQIQTDHHLDQVCELFGGQNKAEDFVWFNVSLKKSTV